MNDDIYYRKLNAIYLHLDGFYSKENAGKNQILFPDVEHFV